MIATKEIDGKVIQVIGSTFDVEFPEGHLPEIYNAVRIDGTAKGVTIRLVGEVQQHLGGNRVRAVALGSTEGLYRGMTAVDTGSPVRVPVGKETLGRVFNLLGEQIDGRGPIGNKETRPIHGEAAWNSLRTCRRRPSSSRPASRSSTCSPRSSAAARRACSAVPASARPSSSRN